MLFYFVSIALGSLHFCGVFLLSNPKDWYIITAKIAVHIISPFRLYIITHRVHFLIFCVKAKN